MPLKLTNEQTTIIDAVKNTEDNIFIKALAGTGKTATLHQVAKNLDIGIGLALAFNKSIKTDLEKALRETPFKAQTLNSLGLKICRDNIPNEIQFNNEKMSNLLNGYIEQLSSYEQREINKRYLLILQLISLAKNFGYMPQKTNEITPLCTYTDFYRILHKFQITKFPATTLTDTMDSTMIETVDELLTASYVHASNGIIDYNDQLLYPAITNKIEVPYYNYILLDEAQDLSAINHKILEKLVHRSPDIRIIAAGDPNQAIYGFRGAEYNSINTVINKFNMTPYPLTVSFRCDREIVKNASWRVSQFKAREDADLGTVKRLKTWSIDDTEIINETTPIICRYNYPLMKLAWILVQNKKVPIYKNKEFLDPLKKIIKRFGKTAKTNIQLKERIDAWIIRERAKPHNEEILQDKYETLLVLTEFGETTAEILKQLDKITRKRKGIQLKTVHEAKGREWDTVVILDYNLINIDPYSQEQNIAYVAETRAKT